MKLDLDPSHLRTCLKLWRDAIDMKMPMKDEFKVHFMSQRPVILKNHERSAAAWLMALRVAIPAPESADDYESLVADIEEFQNWASAELASLDKIATEEQVRHGIDALLNGDPDMAARMAELAKRIQKKPPAG